MTARRPSCRRQRWARGVGAALAGGLALTAALGCRAAPKPRIATPSVPVYEGCYVAFDAPPAADRATGTLVLRLAADPAGMGAFRTLTLALLDCAGANRGAVRDVGWSAVPVTATEVSLDVASGAAVTVAAGPLAAGRWDRVFVAAPHAWGVGADGGRTPLEAHVEPIARGFELAAGDEVAVTMQVTTRARPAGWNGGFNLFTKDAWIDGGTPTP